MKRTATFEAPYGYTWKQICDSNYAYSKSNSGSSTLPAFLSCYSSYKANTGPDKTSSVLDHIYVLKYNASVAYWKYTGWVDGTSPTKTGVGTSYTGNIPYNGKVTDYVSPSGNPVNGKTYYYYTAYIGS